MSSPVTPILQFGTSRFLQAHADLFFSEGNPSRTITIVQSSGDSSRAHRLAALADPAGFPIRIRGLMNDKVIDQEKRVTSVRRTLSTASDWIELEQVFSTEAEIVISNTGDAGYDPRARDTDLVPHQDMSYPAKLFHLLAARFKSNTTRITIMPMELINDNGSVLKKRVLEVASSIETDERLIEWIESLPFMNSLVDRIVSEPIEPAGAVAEPYALWAIEKAMNIDAPCNHPAVQMVSDINSVERLKLYILNLGHTVMAHEWKLNSLPDNMVVREFMGLPSSRATLDSIYSKEVLPGFAAMGFEREATEYLGSTIERFCNPFLNHKISDIAQNHSQKIDRRIGRYLEWTSDTNIDMPKLRAIWLGV